MYIYRPHRGGLMDALLLAKEFDTKEDMLNYICEDHNSYCPWWQITPDELFILDQNSPDERVGWHNMFWIVYERPSKIKYIDGYKKYLGLTEEDIAFKDDTPCGVLGSFSNDYDIEIQKQWMERFG